MRKERERGGERNHCDSVYLKTYSTIFRRHLHDRGWPILNLPINFERIAGLYFIYTTFGNLSLRMAFVCELQYLMQVHTIFIEMRKHIDCDTKH